MINCQNKQEQYYIYIYIYTTRNGFIYTYSTFKRTSEISVTVKVWKCILYYKVKTK